MDKIIYNREINVLEKKKDEFIVRIIFFLLLISLLFADY